MSEQNHQMYFQVEIKDVWRNRLMLFSKRGEGEIWGLVLKYQLSDLDNFWWYRPIFSIFIFPS